MRRSTCPVEEATYTIIGGEDGKWGLLRFTQVKPAYYRYG
jgi:hypothetical protein